VTQVSSVPAGLLGLAAVLVAVLAFGGALWELVHRWNVQEEYSHGFLIPVVAAWLLWTRRDALIASIGRPAWTGPALILLAMLAHIVGELSAIFILSQVGFVLVLIGIALSIGGYSLLRVALVPILFLLFAIPLPYFIDSQLTLQLQLISSQLGTFFIRLFQIPVYLEGNIIDMGNYKLQVVEACSGLRYLYPLLSLGFLAAYLFRAPMWQRGAVFLSTIPITILMNGFRIGLVGVTVDRWGARMADEALHFFEGWIIFLVCSGFLATEIYVFARLSGRKMFDAFDVPKIKATSHGGAKFVRLSPLVVALLILCAAGLAASYVSDRSESIPERARFAEFPEHVGSWQGRTALLDHGTEQYLGLDDYIMSDYVKPDGKAVNLYVAYYASQRSGLSPHSPIVCIPGGGWLITNFERTSYALPDTDLPFNRAVIEQNSNKQVVYYWFDERGRKLANEYWSKWYLLTDAILKNRTDGALVRLTTPIFRGESERDADERLQSFMRDVVPTLAGYLPSDTTSQIKAARHNAKGSQS
jgi:exosortase D (VPLPA-CTERM-specific)